MKYFWYKINAYRRAQHETPESCALRLAQMLACLGATHPELARWVAGAEKRGEGSVPTDPISPTQEALTKLFSDGLFRSDIAHRPMPELGYQIHAWNGRSGDCRS